MNTQDLLAFRMMAEVALKEEPADSLAKNFLRVLDAVDELIADRDELRQKFHAMMIERDEWRQHAQDTEILTAEGTLPAELIIIKQRDRMLKDRDELVALLADLFEWEDRSYLHAIMHVENAVRNKRADLGVAKQALEQTVTALERSLAGKPVRNADEIISFAHLTLGDSDA